MLKRNVLVIYTGGTIGSIPRRQGLAPGSLERLKRSVRRFLPTLHCQIALPNPAFRPVDSSNAGPSHWGQIARAVADHYDAFDGFVILHGTDTMAFTASALSFMFEGLGKPVVLTGSQLPLIDERTDARANLANAVALASTPGLREVVICFGSYVIRGNRARKMSTSDLSGFESPNEPPLGRLGERVEIDERLLRAGDPKAKFRLRARLDPAVIDFSLFPGLSADILAEVLLRTRVKGAVIRTFGSGNVIARPEILKVFREAAARGVLILNVTQVPHGRVEMGLYESSEGLAEAGVIGGRDITPEAALTKMMWVLANFKTPEERRRALAADQRGEVTGL